MSDPQEQLVEESTELPFETRKKRKPQGSKPTEIRAFSLTIPSLKAGPPSANQPHTNPLPLSLALDIVQYLDLTESAHVQYTYTLLHPEECDLDANMDPVFLKISADTSSPEDVPMMLDHCFWYEMRHPDASAILQQLLDLDILELVEPARHYKPTDYPEEDEGLPLVRVKIPEKELAKRCKHCSIWEQRTDQERLALCSGCRKAWYVICCIIALTSTEQAIDSILHRFCDDECQAQNWKGGIPTPHKKLCKRIAKLH